MDQGQIVQLIVLIICLFLSSFFSAAETALMSINKIRLQTLAEEGDAKAERVLKLLSDTGRLLSTILVGNNLVNIGASALATSLSIHFWGSTGVGIATGVITLLVLIFGEITPKSLAVAHAETISLAIGGVIKFLQTILMPLTTVLTAITNGLIRLLKQDLSQARPFVTQEDLLAMVNVGHEEGVFEEEEKELLENVFEFKSSQVKNVMTPRTDVVAIDVGISYEDLLDVFKNEQYSRIPVYEGSIDKIIGILHVRDFIDVKLAGDYFDVRKHMRDVFWTYEYQNTTTLLQEMRQAQLYLAVVLDEYGGTAGIITMEDIVEEIIGDIDDEYDVAFEEIQQISQSPDQAAFEIDGSADLEDVNDALAIHLPTDEDYDTISGFLLDELGHIPEEGEIIHHDRTTFIIEKMDRKRIEKVKAIQELGEEEPES